MIDPHVDLEALHEGAQDIYKRGDYQELDIWGDKYAFCYSYLGLDAAFTQGHDGRLAVEEFMEANEAILSDEAKEKRWCKQNPDKKTRKEVPRIPTTLGQRRLALDSGLNEIARVILLTGLLTFYPKMTLNDVTHLFRGSEIGHVNRMLAHLQKELVSMIKGVYDEEEIAEGKGDGQSPGNASEKPTPSTSPSSEASPSLTPETADA